MPCESQPFVPNIATRWTWKKTRTLIVPYRSFPILAIPIPVTYTPHFLPVMDNVRERVVWHGLFHMELKSVWRSLFSDDLLSGALSACAWLRLKPVHNIHSVLQGDACKILIIYQTACSPYLPSCLARNAADILLTYLSLPAKLPWGSLLLSPVI